MCTWAGIECAAEDEQLESAQAKLDNMIGGGR